MDEVTQHSLIQGDNLDQKDTEEYDALNDETFGGPEEAHEYTWSNQPPLGDTVSSAGMGKTTDDVIVKPEGENPQTSLQNLWPSHPMGQTAALDDPLSSSPFSQPSVWKSPEHTGRSTLQSIIQTGPPSIPEANTALSSSPKVISVSELEGGTSPSAPPTATPTPGSLPPDLAALMNPPPHGGPGRPPTFQPVAMTLEYFRTPFPIQMVPGGGHVRVGPLPPPQGGYPPLFPHGLPPDAQRMPHPLGHRPPLLNPHPMYRQGPPPPRGYPMQQQNRWRHDDREGGHMNSHHHHHHHHVDPSPRPWTWDGFMSSKERERFKEIHLSQLQSKDPFNDDYYYQKFLLKSKERALIGEAGDSKGSTDVEEKFKKLVIPEFNREERESYTPREFEGALGKLTKSSVNTPRQVLVVSKGEESVEKDIEKELNSQQKRRKLFMTIEMMYSLMLEIEQIDHKLPHLREEDKSLPTQQRLSLLEQLFKMARIKSVTSTWKKSDDMFFLKLMFIRKGKILVGRLLSLFDQEKCLCVLGALMRNMTALIRRDQNDRVLPHLLPPLLPVVTMLSLREVLGLVNSLAKGPAQVHPPRPALIMAGSSHFGATLLARLIQQGNSASLDEGGPTEKEWSDLRCEIEEKLSEFKSELNSALTPSGDSPQGKKLEEQFL